jgi:hypothetical protein
VITDAGDFRPLVPRRLVPAGPRSQPSGPGTRFRAGELVEESGAPPSGGGTLVLVQLAVRNR